MVRRRLSPLGLFAAILALAAQLVAGALVPQPSWAASHHHSQSCADMGKAPAHDRQHKPDCPFCPFCLAVAHPAPTLAAPPPLPAPSVVLVAHAAPLPPARAPPPLPFPAARPRAPPSPA
ncbi:MAG: hypothetical protein JOY66_17785 [Acetobacteraceae bacterium]|nr:hypothetical protein [Acetobacteraceae bacterium]